MSRKGDLLEAEVPGWDAVLGASFSHLPQGDWMRRFWDRMSIRLDESGTVHYCMEYWNWSQAMLHSLITAVFGMEFLFGRSGWSPAQFLLYVALGNLAPWISQQITLACVASLLRTALEPVSGPILSKDEAQTVKSAP